MHNKKVKEIKTRETSERLPYLNEHKTFLLLLVAMNLSHKKFKSKKLFSTKKNRLTGKSEDKVAA